MNAPRRSPKDIEAVVLDLLTRTQIPLSAYTLADHAAASGHMIVPNQIYRTLARLAADGRVRRLETLGCYMLQRDHAEASLICRHCHRVQPLEAPALIEQLEQWASRFGFTPRRAILETQGRCAGCRDDLHAKA